MDIITATESSALKLEYNNKIENAQDLRKNVLRELKTGKKLNNNLTKEQWKAYREIKEEKNVDIYPFDKGTCFVRIEHSKALEKIREQIGPTKIVSEDPTANYAAKIRRYFSKLNKRNCFSKEEYEKIYPSDPIPPRMYGVIKAHKPEKFYPMRIIISTIGTANYGISEFLVKIIQPVLNENLTRLKNSFDFIKKAESWKIDKDEVQVSFDVVNLYPSVPLKEATLVLIEKLNNNTTYKKLTRLGIPEIKQLIELCLFQCYFHWNNEIHIMENSGPIGLSFMVVLAESFLQFHENNAIKIALNFNPALNLKSFLRYVDDSHARFPDLNQAKHFQYILNQQHPSIQYTIEVENELGTLNYLDIQIMNKKTGKYEYKVYRKDAITNIQIKPHSNHDPNILNSIFKGFLHRAYSICSKSYLQNEINFLIDVFIENGYDKTQMMNIAHQFQHKRQNKITIPSEINNYPVVSLPWVPGLSPKLRKIFRKAGYRAVFKSNPNLRSNC
ncbi:uncharacterized protein LOC136073060 [Hydra vulgaris]|uniref:uncharacterized protein LOC136073060 n=1 Tax=Hydra vulgaris TaxID=6087 RepID=UPI0032EA19E4